MSHKFERDGATFAEKVSGNGIIQVTGWAKLQGELNIFPNRESLDRASRYPSCISGVFFNQAKEDLARYDRKHVVVTGELFTYADLQEEDRPLLPRKVLGNSIILNSCFGPKVLLIKAMKLF